MIPPAKQTAFDNVKSPFLWRHAHNSSSGPKRSRDLDPWILGRSIRWWSKTHGFSLIFWGDEFTWIYLRFFDMNIGEQRHPIPLGVFSWCPFVSPGRGTEWGLLLCNSWVVGLIRDGGNFFFLHTNATAQRMRVTKRCKNPHRIDQNMFFFHPKHDEL